MISSNTKKGGNSSTPTPQPDKDVKTTQTDKEQQKLNELIVKWSEVTFKNFEIPRLAQKVNSNDSKELHHGLIGLRKLLSKDDQSAIQPVIDTGVVPRLAQLISTSSVKRIQSDAAWCLINLCSGDTTQTLYVIQNGAIKSFISLLSSDDAEVAEQGVMGLGNIAGDSAKFRDMILKEDGTAAMVKALAKASNINFKRNGVWALSNFCRGKPKPKFELVSSAIPLFCEYFKVETDSQVLTDVAWGLYGLTSNEAGIQDLLSQNVVSRLVELLSHNDLDVQTPILRIIGNIISGTDEQASVVLKEKNLIQELFKLADSKEKSIKREAFWTLSNITAGTPVQFETIMGNPKYVEKLIKTAKNDAFEVKKEAIWALSNSTKECTPAQIIRLLDNGVFGCLIDLLDEQDPKLLCVALDGIEKCMKWGDEFNIRDESGMNKFVAEAKRRGGVEQIENLQNHQNIDIYAKTCEILETYLADEEDNQ